MIVLSSFTFIPHVSTGKVLRVWPGIDNPFASTDEIEDSGDDGYTTELGMALPEVIRCRILPLSAILQERKRQNMSINILPIPQVKTA